MNNSIIRGTTPAFKYEFSKVSVTDISAAYLTIVGGDTRLTKELADAYIGDRDITWILGQEDTLSLPDRVEVMINWILNDGTRGACEAAVIPVLSNHINEVIP